MKPNIVRVEHGQYGGVLVWVAYLDKPVGMVKDLEQSHIYCFTATDELSAYKEAKKYLDNWFFGMSR